MCWPPVVAARSASGSSREERAGAYLVYQDPADLLRQLDEIGVRTPVERRRAQ
jgi:hypothetical protein